jgi:hypothetical protein
MACYSSSFSSGRCRVLVVHNPYSFGEKMFFLNNVDDDGIDTRYCSLRNTDHHDQHDDRSPDHKLFVDNISANHGGDSLLLKPRTVVEVTTSHRCALPSHDNSCSVCSLEDKPSPSPASQQQTPCSLPPSKQNPKMGSISDSLWDHSVFVQKDKPSHTTDIACGHGHQNTNLLNQTKLEDEVTTTINCGTTLMVSTVAHMFGAGNVCVVERCASRILRTPEKSTVRWKTHPAIAAKSNRL